MGHAHHDHDRRHDAHASMGLGRPNGVHALGRRRFLADLGRGTFAVAILGALAACSGDDDTADAEDTPGSDGASPGAETAGTSDGTATLEWAQVSLGFVSAYVLVRGNDAAVVDTGTGGSADQIGETLATLGVTFDDVRHVVLTHHHPDHIGSLPDVLERAPAATAYAGEGDLANIAATVSAVSDGDDVFGLQVIETPGHTAGSISVLDTGIGLLIAGDALNGNDDGTEVLGPNPDFTADMATAEASVAKLAGFDFDAAAFGHGQPVTTGADTLVRALTP